MTNIMAEKYSRPERREVGGNRQWCWVAATSEFEGIIILFADNVTQE